MKRRLLFMLFALLGTATGTWADVQINSTNFPDGVFRAFVMLEAQNDNNDVLTDAEIAKVTGLYPRFKGIQKLDGIEFFTALKELNCEGNNLTSLDLQRNVNLETLDCSNCGLTSLLVASGDYHLETVHCEQNKLQGQKMTDFLNSLPMVSLYSGATSRKVYLIDGDADNEKNEMVDQSWYSTLSSRGWITFGYVLGAWYEYYTYYSYMIPRVSIDDNFPDMNFRQYVKSNCDKDGDSYLCLSEMLRVKEINVDGKGITKLNGIKYFPSLEELSFSNNNLESPDLSENPKLKKVSCSNNQLEMIDVSKNTLLEYLNVEQNLLNTLNVSANTELEVLAFTNNSLTSIDLSQNTKLTELYCGFNKLISLDVSNNKSVKKIVCQKNNINENYMHQLVRSLPLPEADGDIFPYYSLGGEQNVVKSRDVQIAQNNRWRVWTYDADGEKIRFEGIDVNGITTDMSPISDDAESNVPVFSIDGQRVSGKPTQNGVYIRDGKKVVNPRQ